jgi:hypothetical protein
MDPNNQDGSEDEVISSVKIKPPTFSETSVPTWFRVLEAQFHLARISTTKTKYYHAVSQLPAEVLDRISQTELEAEDYDRLKKAVTTTFEKSKLELFNDLMSKQTYSGKPSIYLLDMLRQACKLNIGKDIVRMQFLKTLPGNVRTVLASHTTLTLQQLGELANDLLIMDHPTTVMAVSPPSSAVASPSTRPTNYTSVGLKPFHQNQRPQICRGHIFYGPNSKSCKKWCKWPHKTGLNILPNSRPPSRSSSPAPRSSSPAPSEN